MYDAFYGFTSEPFRLSPDAHFCFRHRSFSKAKSYFNFALHHGEGFVLVTGRPGTGKTTLIEDLLEDLANTGIMTVRVDSAQLGADDLLRRVAYAFGLEGSGIDKATLLHRLEHFLHQRVRIRESGRALLIVDEAQTLPADALEELRLITNLTNHGQPLVQIFLVGQEALRDLISDPSLEQLHQRILCACHLKPLPLKEMRDYLAHRLECAGWNGDPVIDSGAIRTLYRGSGGIPRLINKLTDRLLLHGGLEEKHELTASDAEYVLEELRSELLLKEDSLPDGDGLDPDIKIEDIRLQQPPITPPEPAPAPEKPPMQPDPVDPVVPVVSDLLPPALPIDALNLVETADQIDAHIPSPILNSAHGNGDIGSAPASAPPHKPNWTKAPSTPATSRDADPAGLNKGSMPKSAWKRGIWMLLTPLVLLLGGGFYFSQGGGMQPIDKVVGFWSKVHDRLRQVSGRDAPSGKETMTAVKPTAREPILERAEPAAPDRDIATLSSAPKPPTPPAEEMTSDEVAAPAFVPIQPSQGLAMSDLAGLTSAMDSSPEPTEIEPASPAPTGTVTAPAPAPETDSTGSAEELPQATIASEPAADTELEELADPTGDASALETAASSSADPVEARLAGLVEETKALGIETELLEPSQVRLVLRNAVAFGSDSARISRKSRAMLNQLSALFVEYDGLSVRIVGHTDDSGGADYNRNLSARRAAAIQGHMISRGVSSERLSSSGKGEDEPLVPSLGEALSRDERLANRRIELWLEPIAAED